MLFTTSSCVTTPLALIRLWMHEANRVYRDKLINLNDLTQYDKVTKEIIKKIYDDMKEEDLFASPHLYCHFSNGIGDPIYMPVSNYNELNKLLVEVLDGYNDINPAMNLVLFEDAVFHVLRINRILEAPRGNALLIGVGGSGKQSLSRLSAFISSLDVFQITLRKGYAMMDLKLDLAALYMKAGVKNIGIVFLMTDAQVAEERFLVLINDLLASGEIPDLFPDDECENIVNAIRPDAKGAGIYDTKENCWKFFIDRVRRNLKVSARKCNRSVWQ